MTAAAASDDRVRILIVDDEPDILLGLSALLVRRGHYVKTFDKPAQALKHIESEDVDYDVVITDYRMPGPISGLDLAKYVKGHTRRGKKGNIKVFLMTTFDIASLPQLYEPELNETAKWGILDEIIPKPIPNDKLIALIEKNFSSNNH
jgi:DNA-binding NtrC family response regulator